jgi:hypothetical protein
MPGKKRTFETTTDSDPTGERTPAQALIVGNVRVLNDTLMQQEKRQRRDKKRPELVEALDKNLHLAYPGQLMFSIGARTPDNIPIVTGAFNVFGLEMAKQKAALEEIRFLGVATGPYDPIVMKDNNVITIAKHGTQDIINNSGDEISAGDLLSWGEPYVKDASANPLKPQLKITGLSHDVSENLLLPKICVETKWCDDIKNDELVTAALDAATIQDKSTGGLAKWQALQADVPLLNAVLRSVREEVAKTYIRNRRRQIGIATRNAAPGEIVNVQLERA